MEFYRHLFIKNPAVAPITFSLVYAVSILFTFQTLLSAYSSSTYLERFLAPSYVSWLYVAGSLGAVVVTLLLPRLLRRIGNVATLFSLSILIIVSLLLVGYVVHPIISLAAFVVYLILSPQIYLNIDVFLETLIGEEEGSTGSRRGLLLTVGAIASVASPIAMGLIVGQAGELENVYLVAALVGLLMIALCLGRLRHFYDPQYETIRVRDMIRSVNGNLDLKLVLANHFLLQFFFAWAVIYIPLYLATYINLDWVTISYIIAAGLLAFVIIQFPAGWLADNRYGEKEMMAIGFLLLAIASTLVSVMITASMVAWMALMFLSRVGASLVEVTTESYFFKKINGRQPNLISLFRLMRPLAQLAGAGVASLALLLLPFSSIFLVLAIFMTLGIFLTSRLNDTR